MNQTKTKKVVVKGKNKQQHVLRPCTVFYN